MAFSRLSSIAIRLFASLNHLINIAFDKVDVLGQFIDNIKLGTA
jgi:hypothetical protein